LGERREDSKGQPERRVRDREKVGGRRKKAWATRDSGTQKISITEKPRRTCARQKRKEGKKGKRFRKR